MVNQPRPSPVRISPVWRVLLATTLMLGMDLVLIYTSILVFGDPFVDPVIEALSIFIATALGAAISVRALDLEWRLTVPAAIFTAIGLVGVGWLDLPFLEFDQLLSGLWLEMDSVRVLYLQAVGIFLVICSAGVFLLPLFDPQVREVGTAPALWKVGIVALGLGLLALLIDYFFIAQTGGDLGLLTLILGSISAAVLVGVGLILALLNLPAIGAWAGGLGLISQALVAIIWLLLGRPWFP